MTNEDRAREIAADLTDDAAAHTDPAEDRRAAAVTYALLAVADRLLDLAAAVEMAGFRKE